MAPPIQNNIRNKIPSLVQSKTLLILRVSLVFGSVILAGLALYSQFGGLGQHFVIAFGSSSSALFVATLLSFISCKKREEKVLVVRKPPQIQASPVIEIGSENALDHIRTAILNGDLSAASKKDSKGRYPLELALQSSKDEKSIEFFIEKTDFNTILQDKGMSIALLALAALYRKKGIVEKLLEKGCDLKETDPEGKSALSYACSTGNGEVVELLCKKGLEINAQDNLGKTPAHYALKNATYFDFESSVDFLLFLKGMRANLLLEDHEGHTPLFELIFQYSPSEILDPAVKIQHEEEFFKKESFSQRLERINTRFSINCKTIRSSEDNTLLHFAARMGFDLAVGVLIELGHRYEIKNKKNECFYHLAAKNGHVKVLAAAQEKNVWMGLKDADGNSILHYAALRGNVEILKKADEWKLNLNDTNRSLFTPLHLAFQNNHFRILIELDLFKQKQGARLDLSPVQDISIIQRTSKNESGVFVFLTLEELIQKGDSFLGEIQTFVEAGYPIDMFPNPLNQAAEGGHVEVMKFFITKKYDPHNLDKDKWSTIHYAVKGGHESAITYLIGAHHIGWCAKENRLYLPTEKPNLSVIAIAIEQNSFQSMYILEKKYKVSFKDITIQTEREVKGRAIKSEKDKSCVQRAKGVFFLHLLFQGKTRFFFTFFKNSTFDLNRRLIIKNEEDKISGVYNLIDLLQGCSDEDLEEAFSLPENKISELLNLCSFHAKKHSPELLSNERVVAPILLALAYKIDSESILKYISYYPPNSLLFLNKALKISLGEKFDAFLLQLPIDQFLPLFLHLSEEAKCAAFIEKIRKEVPQFYEQVLKKKRKFINYPQIEKKEEIPLLFHHARHLYHLIKSQGAIFQKNQVKEFTDNLQGIKEKDEVVIHGILPYFREESKKLQKKEEGFENAFLKRISLLDHRERPNSQDYKDHLGYDLNDCMKAGLVSKIDGEVLGISNDLFDLIEEIQLGAIEDKFKPIKEWYKQQGDRIFALVGVIESLAQKYEGFEEDLRDAQWFKEILVDFIGLDFEEKVEDWMLETLKQEDVKFRAIVLKAYLTQRDHLNSLGVTQETLHEWLFENDYLRNKFPNIDDIVFKGFLLRLKTDKLREYIKSNKLHFIPLTPEESGFSDKEKEELVDKKIEQLISEIEQDFNRKEKIIYDYYLNVRQTRHRFQLFFDVS